MLSVLPSVCLCAHACRQQIFICAHDKTAVDFSQHVKNYLDSITPYNAILADSAYVWAAC